MNNIRLSDSHAKMREVIGSRILWAIDHGTYDSVTGSGSISGWIISTSLSYNSIGLRISIGDQSTIFSFGDFDIKSRFQRSDVSEKFSFLGLTTNELPGFSFSFNLPNAPSVQNTRVCIEIIDLASKFPISNTERHFIPCVEKYAIPDEFARHRVHGNSSIDSYLMQGLSLSSQIIDLYKKYGSMELSDASILDWGCGSGRVARYLLDSCKNYIGIDIDQSNIDWCSLNLSKNFFHVDIHPPTQLPSATFDLIFGISVFTHLTENAQFEWLTELARIAKSGSLIFVTVLGFIAACRTGNYQFFEALCQSHGYIDAGCSPILNGYVPDGYYRTAFHTKNYILSNWQNYLEVIDVVEGIVGSGHQDLVVLRKR